MPYVLRTLDKIAPGDTFVSVYCSVIGSREGELRVDDGTAQATIVFESPEEYDYAKELKKIRVFGKPFKEGNEQIISAQIVQNMENLDIEILKKVMSCLT